MCVFVRLFIHPSSNLLVYICKERRCWTLTSWGGMDVHGLHAILPRTASYSHLCILHFLAHDKASLNMHKHALSHAFIHSCVHILP